VSLSEAADADLCVSWDGTAQCLPEYNMALTTEVQGLQIDTGIGLDLGMSMDSWSFDPASLPLFPAWLHGSADWETLPKESKYLIHAHLFLSVE
jgi:hypothetical protein